MNIPSPILTLLIGIFVTLASLWYGQNHGLMPVAASSEAELVDGLFNTMMTIGTGLFLLVGGALVVAAIRFRRPQGDEGDGAHLEGNIPLEIVWTAIPAVIVLGISIYSFDIYTQMGGLDLMNHNMAPAEDKTVQVAYSSEADGEGLGLLADAGAGMGIMPGASEEGLVSVDVLGMQYAFIFNYPNGIVDGELHVPVNSPVELNLSAQDVLHAFWLPEFRIKQDMIPGQETKLVFNAIREGTYPVVCAELCGAYHGGMRTQIVVHSQEDYDAWVESRVAALEANETVASLLVPAAERTDAQYLETFAEPLNLAVSADSLATLHSHHHHQQPE